ncbi:gluconokinase [Thalassobaculum sp. OXR-137]|uniref:gluconokinase n=1 Tax=Thalassobaculum sp. OXR-137 TaxID=3100173 RepID=UPI002AC97421|nr:gluconokinase [Thalassobaculum sp. OXR-137]WPZ32963.1 gluconokinase [Thalassobaculum sp. OXR-137]
MSAPIVVVMMGVSGVGKTTIGTLLAERLGWGYAEGDSYHPPANVEKMRAGTPLDDADRGPWLAAIAADIDRWRAAGTGMVVSCSALKRRYRAILVGDRADVRLVRLAGDEALIRARMEKRVDHYMPTSLLTSQIATLEPPSGDEDAITVDVTRPPEQCVDDILAELGGADASG